MIVRLVCQVVKVRDFDRKIGENLCQDDPILSQPLVGVGTSALEFDINARSAQLREAAPQPVRPCSLVPFPGNLPSASLPHAADKQFTRSWAKLAECGFDICWNLGPVMPRRLDQAFRHSQCSASRTGVMLA